MTADELIGLIDADGPAPGEATVRAFESEYGLALPADYGAFLAATAGGRVRGNVRFSLAGEENGPEIMGSVLGLGSFDHFLAEHMDRLEEAAIPLGLMPVMIYRGGNALALVLRPDRLGEMVFLDHEVSDVGRATLEEAEGDDWGYATPSRSRSRRWSPGSGARTGDHGAAKPGEPGAR